MVSCTFVDSGSPAARNIRSRLTEMQMDVCAVQSVQDALSALRRRPSQAVFVEDGEAAEFVLAHLRRTRPGHKGVYVFGAGSDIDTINAAIQRGASDYLLAPVDTDLLRFKLAQAGIAA